MLLVITIQEFINTLPTIVLHHSLDFNMAFTSCFSGLTKGAPVQQAEQWFPMYHAVLWCWATKTRDNSPTAEHCVGSNIITVAMFFENISHDCDTITIVSRCARPDDHKITYLNFLLHRNFPCRTADGDRTTLCVCTHSAFCRKETLLTGNARQWLHIRARPQRMTRS